MGAGRTTTERTTAFKTRNTGLAGILATEIRAGSLLERDKRRWRVPKSCHVQVGGRGCACLERA